MSFGAREYLWLLVVPALVYAALHFDLARQRRAFAAVVPEKFRRRIVPDWNPHARISKARLSCLALALAVLALARPQWGWREETIHANGADVMLLLDVSRSMEVEDVVPSRLKKARHWIRGFVDRMAGNRVGVVAFAESSYVACPLTTDLDYVSESVAILGPASVVNQGTDIGLGLSTALAAIERGSESPDAEAERKGLASKAVVLISDGEDHEAATAEAAAKLRKSGVKLFVLGVGTERGGPIPVRDEAGNLQGYKRAGGQPVVSRFDHSSLEKIASDAGGRYWNMSQSESEVDEILAALGALGRERFEERKARVPIDRYQWPLALAVVLFAAELALPLVLRRGRSAAAPGTGLVLLAGLLLPLDSGAAPIESYMKNREGLGLFSKDEVEGAEKKFGEAQAADPRGVEPQFNLGVVRMKKGDAKSAIESFERAARSAGMAGDAGLSAQSLYNLGSARESSGDRPGALRDFAGAVRMAELARDDGLATEARKRIQNLQQQMQQGGSGRKQDRGKGQGQQPQDSQGSGEKNDEKQGEKQQNPRQYEDPSVSRRRQFQSEKLSPEDSERVMAELSAREQELQAKLKKQRGARQVNNDKDW